MRIIDIKDVPGMDLSVPNGMDSVSRGLVKPGFDYTREVVFCPDPTKVNVSMVDGQIVRTTQHLISAKWSPHCTEHGAMNKVSRDGIWRCLQHGCHVGCYLIEENS